MEEIREIVLENFPFLPPLLESLSIVSHPALCARKLIFIDFIKRLSRPLTSDLVWMMDSTSGWVGGRRK